MFKSKDKKIVTIEGMKCNHCAMKVENTLKEIDGVKSVKVNLDKKCAIIKGAVEDNLIKEKIESLDYKVIKIENN